MAGLLIPNDWTSGDHTFLVFQVPDSPAWRATVKGQVYGLKDSYRWDSATGDADAAAQIGQEIFDSSLYVQALDGGTASFDADIMTLDGGSA